MATQTTQVKTAAAAETRSRVQREKFWSDLSAHVICIVACAIALFPPLWILSASFKPGGEIRTSVQTILPQNPTLDNYRYTLFENQNGVFWSWLTNSVIVAGLTSIVGVFFAATAAYAFSRFNFVGKGIGLMSFLVVQMFPGMLLLLPLFNILSGLKLINSIPGLVLAYTTTALPFCVWMMKSFFDTIPYELEEAALVDGLGKFGTFWRIAVPLSLPGISVVALFAFMTAWNEFLQALVFMTGNDKYTIPVGLRTFVDAFKAQWEYFSAGAVVVTIPVLFFFLWTQRFMVSGLTQGGVKG